MGRPLLAQLYGQGLPQTPFREVPWAPAHATLLPRVLGEQSVDGAENGGWWGGRSEVQEDLAAELTTMGRVTKCVCAPPSIFLGSNS